ncbi:CbtA family protein [Carnimonas nigrificans]|uniref:CbtA family protein n=1 Tax=Carnimonas nigrificans TaxID=64323 RepID=UPI00046FFDA6|nr:CbtA family protein [Carnimonas nigrificans]
MTAQLLLRGMLIGLLASILAFAFAWWAGEPNVSAAIALEEASSHGHQHGPSVEPDEEPVSREVQSTIGLFTGIAVYSTALGGIFALAYAFAQGRTGRLQGRTLALIVALCGFVALVLVPWLKYPANPPAVGSPDTIGQRTALYFGMLLISVVAMIAACLLTHQRRQHHDVWSSALSGAALYAVIVVLAWILLPGVDEVPQGFPADILFNFRLTSLGINAIVWACLGLGFGYWIEQQRRSSQTLA